MPIPNNNVTVTGKLGPGNTVTALLFEYCTAFKIDFLARTIDITNGNPDGTQQKSQSIQGSDIATVTDTVADGVHTIAIST